MVFDRIIKHQYFIRNDYNNDYNSRKNGKTKVYTILMLAALIYTTRDTYYNLLFMRRPMKVDRGLRRSAEYSAVYTNERIYYSRVNRAFSSLLAHGSSGPVDAPISICRRSVWSVVVLMIIFNYRRTNILSFPARLSVSKGVLGTFRLFWTFAIRLDVGGPMIESLYKLGRFDVCIKYAVNKIARKSIGGT